MKEKLGVALVNAAFNNDVMEMSLNKSVILRESPGSYILDSSFHTRLTSVKDNTRLLVMSFFNYHREVASGMSLPVQCEQ